MTNSFISDLFNDNPVLMYVCRTLINYSHSVI